MKTPLHPRRCLGLKLPCFTLALASLISTAYAVLPPARPVQPAFDKRAPAAMDAAELALRQKGQAHLQSQAPFAVADFDHLLGTPKFVRDSAGFLTGPNGQGHGISSQALQAIAADDPHRAVKAFLNEHSALFGFGAEGLTNSKVNRESVGPHNGLRTVVWQQQVDGVPVFESVLIGNITRNGELATISSQLLSDPSGKADAGTPNRRSFQAAPPVSAQQALVKAAANLGEDWTSSELRVSSDSAVDGYTVFRTPREAFVRKVWLPLDQHRLRLAWEVTLDLHTQPERYLELVDAQSGEVWVRRCLTEYISPATYNVWTSDSPSPFSPGWPTPNLNQPPLTNRFPVTIDALSTNASPNGWIDDTNNTTDGNNATAFVDRNFDQQPDGPLPVGNPNRVFDYPQDLTQDPLTYSNASTVQLFYWANYYHDRLYDLGFTEAAGNYQQNNFGRGGLGNDNIICYCQAGADVGLGDNSFFVPAPDGFHGGCYMFVFTGPTPERDGSLDTDVVLHELTHGTSTRLVGGGVGISALQPSGMGEGWSDFYAISLASQAGDDVNGAYASGGYVTYQFVGISFANYYFGIRHYPYCTDMTKNPFTFKDIDPAQISAHTGVPFSPIYSPFDPAEADEVHHQGEVWCVTLWDCRANLVTKLGYAGNQTMLQIVTDGMKLSPANPTFLQARDAIILADRIDNNGANYLDLWRGFAKRGMGVSARSPNSDTTAGVVEGYDLPGLQIISALVSGGNGNGIVDFNECNALQIGLQNSESTTATHVSARLSTTTPQVIVAQPVSAYFSIPTGATNFNLTPFQISTSPDFVCGTVINFTLVIKSDQGSFTNTFQLPSGQPGLLTSFGNSTPYPIPDNDPTGVSSPIVVSNVTSAINKVTVSLDITHTFDSDLLLELIAPDGTISILSQNNGSSGQNYGAACIPESQRTTFDDAATTPIGSGIPPFVGSFQPQTPLSIFAGKSGLNANGVWQLHVVDQAALDSGTIQCWSLNVFSTLCTDGGGTCPGVNLALGLADAPDPVFLGSNLVYTITVTNFGPSIAKGVTVSQALPNSAIFVFATASQGSTSFAGGNLSASLGNVAIGGTATITVTVIPTALGLMFSTATVSSVDAELDPTDNTATTSTFVNPPASDLAVGLAAAPNPALVGGVLTYSVSVTNFGPSIASGVTVTNLLPPSVGFLSANSSQGNVSLLAGNIAVCSFGALGVNRFATATIRVTPGAAGTITASAIAAANQNDPLLGNNTAVVNTVIGPAADLAVTLVGFPNPVVQSGALNYTITVVNQGPNTATPVSLSGTLPNSVTVVSNFVSQGTLTINNNSLSANLGSLPNGASATIALLVTPNSLGTNIVSVTVTAPQADPNPANNTAIASTVVALPFVRVSPAAAQLLAESFSPPNGALDIGETVTVSLALANTGNVMVSNLTATLLSGNGVSQIVTPTQAYGSLLPGFIHTAPFTFTATGTNGGSVVATLQVSDTNGYSTNVSFTFPLPNVVLVANTNLITIPDSGPATPYPSVIHVTGVTGQVSKVTATLAGLSHTYPHDVNVLLVGPLGTDTILMSHVADTTKDLSSVTLTFDDAAASPLPDSSDIFSGTWQPTAFSPPTFPTNAPAGPYPVSMSVFNGLNPNGNWSLYVYDDSGGDQGQIANGWSLALTTVNPIDQVADLSVTGTQAPNPVHIGDSLVCTYTVTNAGPSTAQAVLFTNVLPANATLVSVTPSQGNYLTSPNLVTAVLGDLSSGAVATVTIVLKPTANGWLTNTAGVTASQIDLHLSDNTVSLAANVVSPFADVGVSQSVVSNPALVSGSNATFTITVTNAGPNAAVGVVVTNVLPASLGFISASTTLGSITNTGGTVSANLGNLDPGGLATLQVTAAPLNLGAWTNRVSVTSLSSIDTNSANDSASLVGTNLTPVIGTGASLVSESFAPPDGGIDPGENVTIAFSLANAGVVDLGNVVATLQASGGIVSPSGAQAYGLLQHGGASVARSFSFTAGAPVGGLYLATLALQNGTTNLGTVTFTFAAPTLTGVSNSTAIIIPDHGAAAPYPATLNVSGISGLISKVTVRLNGLTHAFPSDVNVLLVSPAGYSALLMSHTGGGSPVTNINLTFDDAAAAPVPASTALLDGAVYQPAAYGGAVTFPGGLPTPYGPSLAALNGASPNGTWKLYVFDDSVGDAGVIAAGWSLNITAVQSVNPVADLAVTMTAAPSPIFLLSTLTYSITVNNRGPASASGVVLTDVLPANQTYISCVPSQGNAVNAAGHLTWTVGSLAAGSAATATLNVTASQAASLPNVATGVLNESDLNLANNTAQATVAVLVPVPAVLFIKPSGVQFEVSITGEPGQTYRLEYSSGVNPVSWHALVTSPAPSNGIIKYVTTGAQSAQRFYRAVRIP